MLETNVHGLMRMTRLCLPHIRDDGHIVNMGSIAGRQAYENAAVYVASKFAVRGFTYALREDLLGRPIRLTTVDPGLVESNFSRVRFRGDEEKASGGLRERRADHAGRRRRVHPLRAHAAAARERRRARGQGAARSRARPGSCATPDGADDPRRLDLLHLRRARRHRRRDARPLRRRHALPLAALPDRQRRRAAAALVGQGRVLLGRVLPAQPARRRPAAGLALDHPAALRRRRDAGPRDRRRTSRWSRSPFELALELGTDFADILSVKEHDFALGDPARAEPLPEPVAADVRGGAQPVRPRGAERRRRREDAGDPLPARRDRGRQGRLPARARPARELGAAARHPRLDRRRLGHAAHGRAALRRGADARARVARRLAAARAADPGGLGPARPRRSSSRSPTSPRCGCAARAAPAGCPRPGCRGS